MSAPYETKDAIYPGTYDGAQQSSHYPSTENQYYQYVNPRNEPSSQPNRDIRTETHVHMHGQSIYGSLPMQITCPNCHQESISKVNYTSGTFTWILVILCILLCGWLGCCLIPFCIDSCKDCEHYCPNCNTFLGAYKRM